MAFGPIRWLASFAIFFIVLGVITWSAVHLGKRDSGNSMDIAVRFLDDYFVVERDKSLSESAIERGSPTSRMTESTDDPTPFANHRGVETSDITEFYKVWQALSSTRDHVGTTWNDAATAVPSATSALFADDDSTPSEDIPTTTVWPSNKPVASDDRRTTVSEKEIEPQDGVSLVTRPTTTTTIHRASFFDDMNNGSRTID